MNAKKLSVWAAALAILGVSAVTGARTYQKPKTVIQVVTIRWTADAAPEQRRAALEGVDKLAAEFPGVRNVWLRPLRLQPRDFMSAYAIEFDDQAAAERFAKLPAHEAWNKSFLPLIEESRTQQLTN
jgi:hypothetical protein